MDIFHGTWSCLPSIGQLRHHGFFRWCMKASWKFSMVPGAACQANYKACCFSMGVEQLIPWDHLSFTPCMTTDNALFFAMGSLGNLFVGFDRKTSFGNWFVGRFSHAQNGGKTSFGTNLSCIS